MTRKNQVDELLTWFERKTNESFMEGTDMKEITVDQTEKIIFDYISKLAKQHKLDLKKDIFNVVLPLENNQAISCYVGPNEDGERAVDYTVKPDIDNISKIIMDGMNPKTKRNKQLHKMVEVMRGIYHDDMQVTTLLVKKRYSERPRVEVKVMKDLGDWSE